MVFFVDSGLSKLNVDFPNWYNYVIPFIHVVKVLDSTEFNKLIWTKIERFLKFEQIEILRKTQTNPELKYFSAFCNHEHNLHGGHHLSGEAQSYSQVWAKKNLNKNLSE